MRDSLSQSGALCTSLYVCPGQNAYRVIVYSERVPVPPFDRGQPGYLYVLVADHLEARILAGELPKGSRLPAERELGRSYQVAVGTIRQAVAELRDRGRVVTYAAKGTYVA